MRIILFIKKVIKYFFLFDYFSYLMCCNFYPSYTLLWLLMIIQICYLIVNYFTQISIEKKHYWNLFCIQNDINQISESYIYTSDFISKVQIWHEKGIAISHQWCFVSNEIISTAITLVCWNELQLSTEIVKLIHTQAKS